jgi:hypothetical protein
VSMTAPNAWRKVDKVALCPRSLRAAFTCEIMIALKLPIAASRALRCARAPHRRI